ncbi:MAG TPA: CotH kinase family protein, partial [Cyclobacteriaceae bacterium]|nr:CotH kinase family protein [Cyclobacteriaceae bacterium]
MMKIFFISFFAIIQSYFVALQALCQVSFESSNLPIIKINTLGFQIPDEPKIKAAMQIIDNGSGIRNSVNDSAYNYNGYIGIERRGSSSQGFPKNNYGFETWTESGSDTAVSLLGLPEEVDWVLHGPYSDKSLIRNVLSYKLSNEMGRYASRTVFCELILNETYWGLYVLMEKVKRDKNRIDIANLDPDENAGDSLTGGYIVKLDKYDGVNSGLGWPSPYRPVNFSNPDQVIYFQYEYPKNDEITQTQMKYIKDYITAFESALSGSSYNDPVVGYQNYADVSSMIDYAIINEIPRNIDGYRLSTFIYKDKDSKGGKLMFGPIWDLNLGYGNADYCNGEMTSGWAYRFNDVCNQDWWQVPFWWYKLMRDHLFRSQMLERWTALRQDALKTERIMNYIDSVAIVLEEAAQRNFIRWPVLGTYIWPNSFVGYSYAEEINFLKSWLGQRLDWLDSNMEIV